MTARRRRRAARTGKKKNLGLPLGPQRRPGPELAMSGSENEFYSGPAPHTSVVPPWEAAAMPPARLSTKRKEVGCGSGFNSAGASGAASKEEKESTEEGVVAARTSRPPLVDSQVCRSPPPPIARPAPLPHDPRICICPVFRQLLGSPTSHLTITAARRSRSPARLRPATPGIIVSRCGTGRHAYGRGCGSGDF